MNYDGIIHKASGLWQELEYRKRLKKLIESGISISEIEKQAKQLFKEYHNVRCVKAQ